MSLLQELRNKLSHLAGRRDFDESIAEEMRLHLESRADELEASGMSRPNAMAQARKEFGPTSLALEDSRGAWRWTWPEDLLRDLKHAWRTLRRDRGIAITAIVSFALGIGVNTTIFSLTKEFLFSSPSVRDAESLVAAQVGGMQSIPMREYRFLRDAEVFDGLAGAVPMQEANWRTGETSLRLFVTRVTDNFFDVTGVPLAMGRTIRDGERRVVIVGHNFWRSKLNADPQMLGRVLVLDGEPHTVIGVLPQGHRTLTGFGYSPDIYLPVVNESTNVALYGRVPADSNRTATLGKLQSAAARMDQVYPDGTHKWATNVTISGLIGIERLTMGFMRTVSAFFAMLMGTVALLMLIACANVASLLLARASTRMQEFAIRISIGAGRSRLIRQLLAESLLLSMVGTGVGLFLNYGLIKVLNGLVLPMPFPIALAIQPDWPLFTYAAIVGVASAVMAGLLPALVSTRSGTSALLKSDEHQVSAKATLRNVLITGQLAISVVVLVLAVLSVRNLIVSTALDPGFDIRQTVWAQMRLVPESYPSLTLVRAKVTSSLEQLQSVPGISAATVAGFVPLNDHFASRSSMVYTDAAEEGERLEYWWNAVGPDYLKTMGIDLIAGREFTNLDRDGAQRVLIVNESFAKKTFGNASPLGHRVRLGRTDKVERVVVGVARNSKYSSLGERDRSALYEPYFQVGGGRTALNFLVRTNGSPVASLKPINAALLATDATAAVELKRMSDAMGFALLPTRFGATLLSAIGILGLLLAAVGLYGVLAYSIGRRTREIGLRIALGAQRQDVLRLALREGAWIVTLGMVIGLVISVFITKPLAILLMPGLRPFDPLTYIAVVAILSVVGIAASLTPALRASRIDPMTALRHE